MFAIRQPATLTEPTKAENDIRPETIPQVAILPPPVERWKGDRPIFARVVTAVGNLSLHPAGVEATINPSVTQRVASYLQKLRVALRASGQPTHEALADTDDTSLAIKIAQTQAEPLRLNQSGRNSENPEFKKFGYRIAAIRSGVRQHLDSYAALQARARQMRATLTAGPGAIHPRALDGLTQAYRTSSIEFAEPLHPELLGASSYTEITPTGRTFGSEHVAITLHPEATSVNYCQALYESLQGFASPSLHRGAAAVMAWNTLRNQNVHSSPQQDLDRRFMKALLGLGVPLRDMSRIFATRRALRKPSSTINEQLFMDELSLRTSIDMRTFLSEPSHNSQDIGVGLENQTEAQASEPVIVAGEAAIKRLKKLRDILPRDLATADPRAPALPHQRLARRSRTHVVKYLLEHNRKEDPAFHDSLARALKAEVDFMQNPIEVPADELDATQPLSMPTRNGRVLVPGLPLPHVP
jgi:hypothetical protein